MKDRPALIGFGEAGSTFARAAVWGGAAIAYDPAMHAPGAFYNAADTIAFMQLIEGNARLKECGL